ncbi:hypothetical protein [Nocardiopsis trehalosi]|uniref:hypothetical protein n=1 Tax=Nocardiopsis trehalosi TaxID=109329 RepID=UPI000830D313|nr:hypothetical protein [Nocardiopsis trehalosi]
MLSGTEAVSARTSLRLLAALPIGTLFIGSTLVGLGGPAAADTAPPVTLIPHSTDIDAGDTATLTLSVGTTGSRVCLYGASADNGFTVGAFTPDNGQAPAVATVSGTPEESVEVTATVTYAVPADATTECADVSERLTASSAAVAVTVTPAPTTPPPTTPPPSTPPPSSPPPSSPPPSTPPPSDPPSSSAPGGTGDGDRGDRDRPSSSASDSERSAPPHSPVSTTRPDTVAPDRPALPTDAPVLPPLDPPAAGDGLADLPTVEPGEGAPEDTTAAASAEQDVPTGMTPAVLLLFLMLLLLLSAPLAPARRVRIGGGYIGRRRRR